MTEERTPQEDLGRLVQSLRLRLEDDGHFGRVAAPRPSGGAESFAAASGEPSPASNASPPEAPSPASPEVRVARVLREEMAMAAARHVEGQDLFDFGSPDLEGGVDREEAMKRIASEAAECTRCAELASSRTQTVPGQGDPNARLVFVGEGPGAEEDRQGIAFIGRAGQLLTKMIESIGLTRDQVYICNVVKCRPPGNRNPAPDEIGNCLPFLMRQLEIIRPKIICTLGGVATQTLLQTHDGITKLRGRFHPYRGVLLMPTFHPAYVLRNYTKDTRQRVYDDLLTVQAELAK